MEHLHSIIQSQALQYLVIKRGIGAKKVFMNSISAYGKLEVVVLDVKFMEADGISSLIMNSPKLHLFISF